jgi:hypothetical protein
MTMRVKVKKEDLDGIARIESKGEIKEILINEDLNNPKLESIAICFMGSSSSGIIEFSPAELEHLYKNVKQRMHLIKGFKSFKVEKGGLI